MSHHAATVALVKLTRHAKNRLRWIERRHPGIRQGLLRALSTAETLGYDDRGNRRVRIMLGDTELIAVVDEVRDTMISLWVR